MANDFSDFEIVLPEAGSDFEILPSASVPMRTPNPANTLNPRSESLPKTVWNQLTDPRSFRRAGPAGLLTNIQTAGGTVGGAIGELYGQALEGGGPISRLWDTAFPQGPMGATGRALTEASQRDFRDTGHAVGELAADPLTYGPIAAAKVPAVAGRMRGMGRTLGVLERGEPVAAAAPVAAPVAPRPMVQQELPLRPGPADPQMSLPFEGPSGLELNAPRVLSPSARSLGTETGWDDFVVLESQNAERNIADALRREVADVGMPPGALERGLEPAMPPLPPAEAPYTVPRLRQGPRQPASVEPPVAPERTLRPEPEVYGPDTPPREIPADWNAGFRTAYPDVAAEAPAVPKPKRPLRKPEAQEPAPDQMGLTADNWDEFIREEERVAERAMSRMRRPETRPETKPAPEEGKKPGVPRLPKGRQPTIDEMRKYRDELEAQAAPPAAAPPTPPAEPPAPIESSGEPRRFWQKMREHLPQEEFVRRARPDSSVITDMEWFQAEMSWRLDKLLKQPFMKELRGMDPTELKRLEQAAVKLFQEQGGTPAAFENALKTLPKHMQDYLRHRADSLVEEQMARTRMNLDPLPENTGPTWPRIQDPEFKEAVNAPGGTSQSVLKTNVKSASEQELFPSTTAGEDAGANFLHPYNAAVIREWQGIQTTQAERLMAALRGRSLFQTEAEAIAVSPSKKAFPIDGLPGGERLYAATREEAKFLEQNLKKHPEGINMAGIGNMKNYADVLFRNPNLINPAPHVVKNMAMKYLLARGPVGATKLPLDMVEFMRGSNPKLLAEFNEFMPFVDVDPAYINLRRHLIEGPAATAVKRAEEMLALLNKGSAKVIFKYGDPAMRYSLFKHYRQTMGPQEAANNAWIDLVRYGTRSDLVDMWKSIPLNFFVPWKVGTYVSVAKQLATHPIRAALTLTGIDAIRELRYRETGRWTHLPWDYIEGPLALALESAFSMNPRKLGREAFMTALFGPGGEATASTIIRLFEPSQDTAAFGKDVWKILWGISQFGDPWNELDQYKKDGDASHIINMIGGVLASERDTKGAAPHRVLGFIPEDIMPKDRRVRGREMSRPKR